MTDETAIDESAQTVALQGELTIYTVAETRNRLLAAMAGADRLTIDLGAVTEIDTAGLQLLLLAGRKPGKDVSFARHSAAVRRAAETIDVGPALGVPPGNGGGAAPTVGS